VLVSVPPCDEEVLKLCLSKAAIRVEAWAQDVAASSGSTGEAVKDMVAATNLALTEEPIVIAQEAEHSQRTSLILAWSVSITLARPRVRMMDPAVSFYSVLTVTYPDASAAQTRLLQPFEAIEKNVFDTLRLAPGQGPQPYLPASALTKIVPERKPTLQQSRIEHMSTRIRLVPVVGSRMTYHRSEQCIIGALNIEVIPYVELEVEISTIQVSIAHGTVEDLTKDLLPTKCRSRDIATFLYRLRQALRLDTNAAASNNTSQLSNLDMLSIRLELSITISELCRPHVCMDYTTNIDFFQALNPTYGGPNQPMQRPHRPASLPLNNTNNQQSTSHSQNPTQPTALNTTLQPTLSLSTFTGISISFTAPTTPAKIGTPFTWRLLVNNKSARAAKLAIYPLPRISKAPSSQAAGAASGKRHTSRLSITSGRSRDKQHIASQHDLERNNVAQAVIDENVLYALQHSHHSPQNQGDIIALTPELRISGLGPGQCHEGKIEFVALRAGTFSVDAVRVVDVVREAEEGIGAVGVMVDFGPGELPDIVVVA
jgi:hypothetical protein